MNPIVHTHISGSVCVVQLRSDWEAYIDAKHRTDRTDFIEVVVRGYVVKRLYVYKTEAPETIVKLMKEFSCLTK